MKALCKDIRYSNIWWILNPIESTFQDDISIIIITTIIIIIIIVIIIILIIIHVSQPFILLKHKFIN